MNMTDGASVPPRSLAPVVREGRPAPAPLAALSSELLVREPGFGWNSSDVNGGDAGGPLPASPPIRQENPMKKFTDWVVDWLPIFVLVVFVAWVAAMTGWFGW